MAIDQHDQQNQTNIVLSSLLEQILLRRHHLGPNQTRTQLGNIASGRWMNHDTAARVGAYYSHEPKNNWNEMTDAMQIVNENTCEVLRYATLWHLLVDGASCWCFPRRNIHYSIACAHWQSCFSSLKLRIYGFQIGQYVVFLIWINFYNRKILVYEIFHTVPERRFIFNFTKIKFSAFKLFLFLAQNEAVSLCAFHSSFMLTSFWIKTVFFLPLSASACGESIIRFIN